MISEKEGWEEIRDKEIQADPFAEGYEYDMGRENYLLSLLDNTIYSDEKKKMYEGKIKMGITSMAEYESLKSKFLIDKINPVTQGGTYGQKDLARHLRKLK